MPWHISESDPRCNGFAVIKDEDNELEGCHRTREAAQRQLAALYANEEPEESSMTEEAWADAPVRENLVRSLAGVELRAEQDVADDRLGTIVGRMANYNVWTEINSKLEGHFLERVAPGAFKKTFEENRHRMQLIYDHGLDNHIGRNPLGPLESIIEDRTGVSYEGALIPTDYNRDRVLPMLRAGVLGNSYRFHVPRGKEKWVRKPAPSDYNPSGLPERTILELQVVELGPTPFPAYPNTPAGVRSETDDWLKRTLLDEPTRAEEEPHSDDDSEGAEAQPHSEPVAEEPSAPDLEPEQVSSVEETEPAPEATSLDPAPAPPASSSTSEEPRSMSFKTIEEKRTRQTEIRARLSELDAQYAGEALTDEARAEWEALEAEWETHKVAIADMEARSRRIQSMEGNPRHEESTYTPPAVWRAPDDVYDLASYREKARSVEQLPDLYLDGARRIADSFSGSRVSMGERAHQLLERVDNPGALAHRLIACGSPTYHRAFGKLLSNQPMTAEETRALATYTNSGADGGYAVPTTLDPTLLFSSDGVVNPIRQIARVETITGQEWNGVTSGAVTVARVAENTAVTENSPTLTQPRVVPTAVKGLIKFSIEVGQDWGALQTEMGRLLADAKEVEESTSFITGTGNGITAPQGIERVADTSIVWTQASGALGVEDIYGLETDMSGGNSLPPRFRARAAFLANKAIYNYIRRFSVGTVGEGSIWVRGIAAGQPSELIGYPAYEASAMDETITNGNDILILGDFSNFIIVDRVGMSIELIPHLFDGDGKPTGSRGLWAMWRNSSAVLVDNAFRKLRVGEGS